MPRLHLIVEGKTEQVFARTMLAEHLAVKGVYLSPAQLAAHARKKHRTHRGGLMSYAPFRIDVVRRLKEDRSNNVFLSMMVDLYAIPGDFPGVEASRTESDPYRRVECIEHALAKDIGDGRFLPHVQLHEFEAMLLTSPSAFLTYYGDSNRQVRLLNELAKTVRSPELINDDENTAPSKRIARLIPDYAKAKPTVGPIIAASIGLATIRAKCPHFDAWLRQLETLGQQPG